MDYNTMKPRFPEIKTRVYGKNSRYENSYLKAATEFFVKKLLVGKRYKINIVISNKKDLDACGYCDNLDYGRNPRNFKIEVHNNMTKQETLETLAHEAVHIAQWATNTMRDGKNRTVLFDNKRYTLNNKDPHVYYFSPWEIDAYGRSIGLVFLWKLHEKSIRKQVKKRAKNG